jgi:uncharacterized protein
LDFTVQTSVAGRSIESKPRFDLSGWCRDHKWLLFVCAALLAFILIVDATQIEPYWIEVTHHSIAAPLNTPITIAHLTDIHTSGLGRREEKMLQILDAERPDLIVITGDAINTKFDYSGLSEVLRNLHAPLGVWIVRGNHEAWWPISNARDYYAEAGVRLLWNEKAEVAPGIWLIGIDDLFAGKPDDGAFDGLPDTAYRIAMFHSPSYFDRIAGRCDLAFSGHSHGGQVRLPFLGPLWTPPFVGRYVAGWFEQKGTRMYVSRGVGTSIADVRFLCRPEIAILKIVPR